MTTQATNHRRKQLFSIEQGLRPWNEVADEYFKRTGERISRTRCWQIAQAAERKIRASLAGSPARRNGGEVRQ